MRSVIGSASGNTSLARECDVQLHDLRGEEEGSRRLEVQAHLGETGEDDLCSPSMFESRFKRLQAFMAMIGVLPPDDPVCVRIDTAVDVSYGNAAAAQPVLEALRFARWPGQWYAQWQGAVAVEPGVAGFDDPAACSPAGAAELFADLVVKMPRTR